MTGRWPSTPQTRAQTAPWGRAPTRPHLCMPYPARPLGPFVWGLGQALLRWREPWRCKPGLAQHRGPSHPKHPWRPMKHRSFLLRALVGRDPPPRAHPPDPPRATRPQKLWGPSSPSALPVQSQYVIKAQPSLSTCCLHWLSWPLASDWPAPLSLAGCYAHEAEEQLSRCCTTTLLFIPQNPNEEGSPHWGQNGFERTCALLGSKVTWDQYIGWI